MKLSARLWLLTLMAALLAAPLCRAQEGDGPPDGGDGMGRAFGRGNGVRGTVTAAAPGNFTVKTEEGDTYKVLYSENTRFMKDRQPIEATEIHVGDMLMAGGMVDAKAKTVGAVVLFDIDAAQVRNAREGFGKTWVAGKVTAIHELNITIERANDKQTQVIAVDENTSFRKRREDVTLADIKVGDFITAQGAVKANTFLAASLRIMTPGAGRPHGGPDQGSGHGPGQDPGQPPAPAPAAPVQ
jgi:hypothetical protein